MEFAELIKTTKVDDVVLSCPGLQPIRGTLAITSHHLLFSSQAEGSEEHKTTELWLLIRSVDAIEKRLANTSGTITLKCKDLKILQLEIPGMAECLNIASSIEALSSLESVMMTYPFFYRPQNTTLGTGWLTHITEQYYEQIATDTGAWRLSSINADFGVCPSYPPVVIVPARLDDGALQKSARFRQGRRFPVLSYYHKKNGTAMLRSSQPLVGPNRKRCYEDEQLLTTILEGGDRGFILDTRGRSLQESFIKLVEACNDPSPHMDRWLSRLEASKWLSHVKEALNAACLAAQCLEREEACVLVHGAEGKDATLLVTALAQAGHPFQLRCAHSAYAHARLKQEAPTFLLFLDCVWQLGRQFPFSLAFNEHLLLALFEHCYASPYGTFLGNNEKER
ncbi:hypothetical protein Chor_001738 [Crotalus horridus]